MKKIIIAIAIMLAILLGIIVAGMTQLGPIIRTAVTSYGPRLTGTDVQLADVSVSLLSGQAELQGFWLGTPQGFNAPYSIKVATLSVDIDEGSLNSDTVIIDRIEIIAPDIVYEKRQGTDNFQAIAANITRATGSEKTTAKTGPAAKGDKNLLIRELVIRDGTVTLAGSMLGDRAITARLPTIRLTDIGGAQGEGGSPAAVFHEIATSLQKSLTSPDVAGMLDAQARQLEQTARDLGDQAKKQLDSLKGQFKGMFGD